MQVLGVVEPRLFGAKMDPQTAVLAFLNIANGVRWSSVPWMLDGLGYELKV